MPSTIEIQRQALPRGSAQEVLVKYMTEFEAYTKRNLLLYYSGFLLLPEERVSIQEEDMEGFMAALYKMDKKKGLDLFLLTPGGAVTATEGIGNYLKSVFNNDINCYVPHMAMSCGTLLAMACKAIYMGKHSCLGPIDPAIGMYRTDAVTEEFENAKRDIAQDPNLSLLWQPILSKYPITLLGECRKATELAKIVSRTWLEDNMFANDPQKEERVETILSLFASHQNTKAHDRHISASEAIRAGLNVKLLEDDEVLQDLALSVHHAATLLMKQSTLVRMVTNVKQIGLFVNRSPA